MAFTDWVGMQDAAVAAKAKALAANEYSRATLRQQYGLGADNMIDPNNTMGSIYQNGAATAGNYQAALAQSMSRGFGASGGGIGNRGKAQALSAGLTNQASQLSQLGLQWGNIGTQDYQASVDYQNQTQSIGRGQADELAQALAANPIQAPTPAPVANPGQPALSDPRYAAVPASAVKKNPTIYRTLRNT